MKKIVGQRFQSWYDRDSSRVFTNIEFERCHFVNCSLSTTETPSHRSIFRNIKWIDCIAQGCDVDAAIFEDVIIKNLKIPSILPFYGTVFKHTIFKGRIGRIMMNPLVFPGVLDPLKQKEFDQVNALYYASVDWALDISEAKFVDCDIRSVPARLIRRDQQTQVIVTRQKAIEGTWRKLDLTKTHWKTSLEFFLERGAEDTVLVAPKASRSYEHLLEGLRALRKIGVAEAD